MLLQWQKQGRFTGKQIVVDATLVKANASMDSLVKREDGDPNTRVLKQYEKRNHDFQYGKRKRRVANQTHVSASDPDATMVYRKGTDGGLKYKVHYSADVKTRIITDCYTMTGSTHEGLILPDRIDYLCDEMGFDVQEMIVDRGYSRGPTYSAFRQRKIRTYIYRCTMPVLVKANSRPLSSSITVGLIDTNVQRGIFSTLMRNWTTD